MRNLLKGIWAGIMIAFGGAVFLACDNKIAGAFLFSIGLMSVIIFGFNLYTGKVCIWTYYKKPLSLLTILIYNLLGAAGMGLLLSGHSAMAKSARLLVEAKLTKPWGVVYIDALLCGVFIGIAVLASKLLKDNSATYLMVVLAVMGFLLSGSEHIVADVFYFATTKICNMKVLLFCVLTALGNTVGGAAFGLSYSAILTLERNKN